MSVTSDQALRESELLVLRGLHDSLNHMNGRLDSHEEKQDKIFGYISKIDRDLAVMAERQLATGEMKIAMRELSGRLDELEDVHNKQIGAATFVTWLKDFGPWIGTLVLLAWGLFVRKP